MTEMQQQTVTLPDIEVDKILQTDQVQHVLAQQQNTPGTNTQEMKEFLRSGLQKLFDKQNSTVQQVNQIFEEIIEVEKVKNSTIQVLKFYEGVDNQVVQSALKNMDTQLGEMKPLMAKLKDSLEGGSSIIKKIFFGNDKKQFLTSLQGIAGRVESLDMIFDKADENLKKNEYVLTTLIPEIGERTAKIDTMVAALEVIIQQTTDPEALAVIKNLRDELTAMSGLQKESLSRLLLLATMNGNSKLVLQATRVEVFMSLQPLIVENIVGANQRKVYEMREKARAGLQSLREGSKQNIETIMNLEKTEKEKLKSRLDEITQNIDWVNQKAKEHSTNMQQAQKLIDDYMPTYKQKVTELEKGIYESAEKLQSFDNVSATLLEKMKKEKEELGERVIVMQ